MRIFLSTCGLVLVLSTLAGCASVTGTRNQPVSVRSTCGGATQVSGAACKLTNDKGEWHVNSTPASVTINRSYGDLAVDCEKPGFGSGTRVFSSAANDSVWGNILVGGIIGYAIDAGGGSGFDYPQQMTVEICNGIPKRDEVASPKKDDAPAPRKAEAQEAQDTGEPLKHLASASYLARIEGCNWERADGALRTSSGLERYQFACANRPTLHVQCTIQRGCQEARPFTEVTRKR